MRLLVREYAPALRARPLIGSSRREPNPFAADLEECPQILVSDILDTSASVCYFWRSSGSGNAYAAQNVRYRRF